MRKQNISMMNLQNVIMTPKKISRLFDKLVMGRTKSNPMPDKPKEILVEDFADFFINKIEKIRVELDKYPEYDPTVRILDSELHVSQFSEVSENDVRKLIMTSKTTKINDK